ARASPPPVRGCRIDLVEVAVVLREHIGDAVQGRGREPGRGRHGGTARARGPVLLQWPAVVGEPWFVEAEVDAVPAVAGGIEAGGRSRHMPPFQFASAAVCGR